MKNFIGEKGKKTFLYQLEKKEYFSERGEKKIARKRMKDQRTNFLSIPDPNLPNIIISKANCRGKRK